MTKWLDTLVNSTLGTLIDKGAAAADRFITTDEDRKAYALELQRLELEVRRAAMDAERAYLSDIQSAREMYRSDNSLQKVFAMTFLSGYVMLTVFMLYLIVTWIGAKAVVIPDWSVALISTIYGAMSSKVNTIVDFLFGSSQGSKDKEHLVQAALERAPTAGTDGP